MMDRIQDSMKQRTAMDTYQTRSCWYLKFVQVPMLAQMFKKFKRTSPERSSGVTKRTWTCTAPERLHHA
eukprot:6200046-Pleurochrysis_carterae.AAC.1